jgi:hypothetical protein
MKSEQNYGTGKLKLSFPKIIGILVPYIKSKFLEQIKSIWFIIFYLVIFQVVILRLPIVFSLMISVGIAIVVLGLMFFMEGLVLGLMPFGEVIGSILPKKSKLPIILIFAFLLGMGATFAEPAIAVLKAAGSGVSMGAAPLLYSLLNDFSGQLVACVGAGVGVAVLLGILRFMYGWSLKVLITPLVVLISGITIWAHFHGILEPIIGLAWDCGAVTTGPVTVPLVLALGIGVCRIVGSGDSGSAGFGVVTLASLFPILAVLLLGIYHYQAGDYVGGSNYAGAAVYKIEQQQTETGTTDVKKLYRLRGFSENEIEQFKMTGKIGAKHEISYEGGTSRIQDGKIYIEGASIVFTKVQTSSVIKDKMAVWDTQTDFFKQIRDAILAALQAIIPLCIFLLLTIKLVLREKVPHADEIFLGICFSVIGMALFSLGITLGLTPLGNQVGSNTPAAFTAVTPWGLGGCQGPLYNEGFLGKLVAVGFGFVLGYGATLAEPALNALGATVEKITIGAFRKSLLMQTVALGVAAGIGAGVFKLAFNIPLSYMLIPLYVVAMVLTFLSSEEFVNFGWDSAGVTTGPITVPLVLAMGLGIGSNIPDVLSGFGVLALASVCPIIAVLLVGLFVKRNEPGKEEGTVKEVAHA